MFLIMKRFYITIALVVLSNALLLAQYSLPLYEPFNIALGQLAGQDTWTGNVVASGNGAQVVNKPLAYSGLSTQASSYAVSFGNQTNGGTQALGIVSQTTTVYASFLMQVTSLDLTLANSKYNVGFGNTTAGGTFAGCMYVVPNVSGTTFELGFDGNNSQPAAGNTTVQTFALNTTIMVVLAYTPSATSGAGTVSAWINPASASFGAATAPTPTFSNISGGKAAAVASFFIRSGNNTNPMVIDELRTSWADATTNNVVLPVVLSDFSITTKGNISTLYWASITESNFDKYSILYSKNGISFNEIGNVKALGDNNKYTFNYTHNGDGYFKLKLVDLDGRYAYSDILHSRGKSLLITAGPNPFTDKLEIAAMPKGVNIITLYALNGTKVYTQTVNDSDITLLLPNILAGKYVLNIANGNNTVYSGVYIKN
jgi:hypothetical protein